MDNETPDQPDYFAPMPPAPAPPPFPMTELEAPGPSRPRRRWVWVTSLVAVVVVAAAAVVVTGRHSPKTPLEVLTAASGRTTGSQSARVSSVETISTNGLHIDLIDLSGETDWVHKASSLTMSSRGTTAMEIRQVAGVTYMSTSLIDLPGGATWIAIRPSDLKLKNGQSPLGSNDPSSGLQYLSAIKGNPRVIGHAQVVGTDTTHYRFTINLQEALNRIVEASKSLGSDTFGSSLGQLKGLVDLTKIPAQAWIDGAGRVRKFQFELNVTQDGESADVVDVLSYSHFDEPVSVSPPAASDTIPFSQFPGFFGQLGKLSSQNPST